MHFRLRSTLLKRARQGLIALLQLPTGRHPRSSCAGCQLPLLGVQCRNLHPVMVASKEADMQSSNTTSSVHYA